MESGFFKFKNWFYSLAILATVVLLVGGCVPVNNPPVITSLKAKLEVIFPLDSCLIECIASDEDGDELVYEWSVSEGEINGNGAAVAWTAPEQEGIYNIMVSVTDGKDGEATDSVTIIVKANHLPGITSLVSDADWITVGNSCDIECQAEDEDGDELNYEWSASGGDISGTGSAVVWTAPAEASLYSITVVVTDGYGGEDSRVLAISVSYNPPPVIEELIVTSEEPKYLKESSGVYAILIGKSCNIECVITNASDELYYEWSAVGKNTEEGEISGGGSVITWVAPDNGGRVTITVTVSDFYSNKTSKNVVFTVKTCACSFN